MRSRTVSPKFPRSQCFATKCHTAGQLLTAADTDSHVKRATFGTLIKIIAIIVLGTTLDQLAYEFWQTSEQNEQD